MSTLSLHFMGPTLISLDGAEVKLPRRKAVALLAYLAVTGRTHSRDALAELLYPGHDREQAYSDFRQTLSAVRGAIGEQWIEADRAGASLARREGLWIDTEELGRLLAGARITPGTDESLRQAAELIRGPFLSGFYLKNCPEFEEWQAAEAERLRREESRVLRRLVESHEERGERAEAIEWCRKLVALDPLEEEMHRRLMLLYTLSGQRAAALAQYAKCAAVLKKELDETPSPETQELKERIASGRLKALPRARPKEHERPLPPAAVATTIAPRARLFVGRAEEGRVLAAAVEDARSGRGRLLVVVGEPGIGKTRLLEEAASRAAESGALVLWGRCHDDEGLPPLWPWRQILGELARRADAALLRKWVGACGPVLADIVPDLAEILGDLPAPPPQGDAESDRFRLFEALFRLLRSAAEARQLVLVLDDLHWADPSTLRLLGFLARGLPELRLAILCSSRPVETDRTHPLARSLGELAREAGFERLELDALNKEELAELATGTAGSHATDGVIEVLWQKTRGNPLFVLELLRSIGVGVGGTADPEAVRQAREMAVPPNVRAVIRRRLDGLSHACSELLATAAAAAAEIDLELLALVTELPRRELLRIIDEASAARIVAEVPDRPGVYRFSHPLVQESLAGELSVSGRADTHARIAAALEEQYGPMAEQHATEIAHHLGLGQPLVDRGKVARYSLLAGEQALAAFDPEAALRHFERGLAARGPGAEDAEAAWLRYGLARSLVPTPTMGFEFTSETERDAGRGYTALKAAFEYFEAAGDIPSALRVAEYPIDLVDRSEQTHSLFDRALRLAQPGSVEEARILIPQAHESLYRTNDYGASRRLWERALEIARRHGDRRLELRALAIRIQLGSEFEPIDVVRTLLPPAMEVLREVDDPHSEYLVRFRSYHAAVADGDHGTASARAATMAAIAQRLRSVEHQLLAELVAFELASYRGDWAALRAASDRALLLRADMPVWRQLVGWRAQWEFELGAQDAGERHLASYLAELERVGIGPNYDCALAVGILYRVALLTGDAVLAEKAQSMARAWTHPWDDGGDDRSWAWWASVTVAMPVATDAAERGDLEASRRLRGWISRQPGSWRGFGLGETLSILGRLDLALGDADGAVANCLGALAVFRHRKMVPSLAWGCLETAEALLARGARGDGEQAKALLAEGLERATSLGLRPLVERIRKLQAKS